MSADELPTRIELSASVDLTVPFHDADPAGVYRLQVEKPGFKRLVREPIEVTVQSITRVDATRESMIWRRFSAW